MDNKSSATLVAELRSAVSTAAKINARLSVTRAVLCGEVEAVGQVDPTVVTVLVANLRAELSAIRDQMNRIEIAMHDLDTPPAPEGNRASVSGVWTGRT
jgi:hypothetical protein